MAEEATDRPSWALCCCRCCFYDSGDRAVSVRRRNRCIRRCSIRMISSCSWRPFQNRWTWSKDRGVTSDWNK